MRICLVYDCLYPHTVGGAERWYRNLAERLAAEGHEVTYLTLRQWGRETDPGVQGVHVVAVGPRMELYAGGGRRKVGPPLLFGLGVLAHLLRHGGRYDAVHTASFPYFSVLAAAAVAPLRRFRMVVDWHEVWTRAYWEEYLGAIGGAIGWLVQKACLRVRQTAFCFSRLHARRLREEGLRGDVTVLEGEYAGEAHEPDPAPARPVAVFAGRHIPEKRVTALPPALAAVRRRLPELTMEIYGDGPDRGDLLAAVREMGLSEAVTAPGFVPGERVDEALRSALCMVLPSRREGYGLVVVEAAARGTPSVVVSDPDNAATELVSDGENGVVAASAGPEDLADAILRVHEEGERMREATARWFARNAERLSMETSLDTVATAYSRRDGVSR